MTAFENLVHIIKTLRHPETGCPWDKKQTSASLIPNFIEEVYEAVEAIEDKNYNDLCEELGDVMLHIIFQIQLAEEQNKFTLDDVMQKICDKLITRHPHIFGDLKVKDEAEVKQNWELIKLSEKKKSRKSVLDGIPKNMPALIQASRIQEKAAHIGFDWDTYEPVLDKIYEEIEEVKAEIAISLHGKGSIPNSEFLTPNLEMELGDLFFAVVNLSRKLKIDSESALRKSNQKFKDRFQKLESLCEKENINMNEVGLEKLDELWEFIKKT